jgi:hypothetical protein
MSESSHNIVVSVDSSRARQGLADLQKQAQSTAQTFRSLGSSSGGFDTLAKQVQDASGAFNQLARSLATASAAARSIAALSSSGNGLSSLSRGAHDARNAVQGLTSALNPFSAAMKGIAVLAGGLSLDRFSRSVLETGNAVTSFKLALDSIATSPREAGDMFDYVAATSNKMGVSLESNLESFKNLRVSMASLGVDTQRTMNLFESLQKTFVALHTTPANVKRARCMTSRKCSRSTAWTLSACEQFRPISLDSWARYRRRLRGRNCTPLFVKEFRLRPWKPSPRFWGSNTRRPRKRR